MTKTNVAGLHDLPADVQGYHQVLTSRAPRERLVLGWVQGPRRYLQGELLPEAWTDLSA